jgi:hypothetical protein
MREIMIEVSGYPPAKNEAKPMLAPGHVHAERVPVLLQAASNEAGLGGAVCFPDESLGLELVLTSPAPPPSDATNYLGGVADVLENKGTAASWRTSGSSRASRSTATTGNSTTSGTGGSRVRMSTTKCASGRRNDSVCGMSGRCRGGDV